MAEGRRAHRHTAPRSGSSPLIGLATLALGAILAGVAWFYLVRAAIDFGDLAMSGQAVAWPFTLAAAGGAAACLMLVLALVGRGLRRLGFLSDRRPTRGGGRRRR